MRTGQLVHALGEVARAAEFGQIAHIAIALAVVRSTASLLHFQWAEVKFSFCS